MLTESRHLIYWTKHPESSIMQCFTARGWQVDVVDSARRAERAASRGCAAGLADLSRGVGAADASAMEDCLRLPHVGWIAATRRGQLQDTALREMVRDYCFDYVTLPWEPERIVEAAGHAYGMAKLSALPAAVRADPAEDNMIGECDAMRNLYRTIRKLALNDAPVFISGESGTGKELTAMAIHRRSPRATAPFVAVNCGAIPHQLMLSELFGHERGAFTGAHRRKIGRVEAAHGGTLFLDEIGDMPMESQAGLLRFLQGRQIERLGGHEPISVDVRVICATHVDMRAALARGTFREDLYHRLCVLRIEQPPLRERGADIETIARYVLERHMGESRRRRLDFAADAITALHAYDWPGNVRELINRVRRAVVMCEGRRITAADLELTDHVQAAPVSLNAARMAAERQAIATALLRHHGCFGTAARELGISRVTLYRRLRAHGMHDAIDAEEPAPTPEPPSPRYLVPGTAEARPAGRAAAGPGESETRCLSRASTNRGEAAAS
ncbi:sigma-54 dependent transcriptional regulator [Burkholderia gladioli]|uniref:sigma-54 dependent transcriptional regulator n=1 Tax=Burkholderia gladioli TaxID=28095 RepID=UPI00163E6F7D|nr:sigma-54 dependent transcriptional regulator [Burkholderia gladioli]